MAPQISLFDGARPDGRRSGAVTPDLPDADLVVYPRCFDAAEVERLERELGATTAWRQDEVVLFGRPTRVPRLQAWHGDAGRTYTYSGLRLEPEPWTPALLEVKAAIEPLAGIRFTSVLCNRYRDGRDGVDWHADDEPELGPEPVIASVSFGATRPFQLRHRHDPSLAHAVDLPAGSLLVMRGPTQACWKHRIPKTARPVGERLNLTFRVIVEP